MCWFTLGACNGGGQGESGAKTARALRGARAALADLLPEHIASRMEQERTELMAASRRHGSANERALRRRSLEGGALQRSSSRASFELTPARQRKQHHIAEWHESVTVLFADVVGFTALSDQARSAAAATLRAHTVGKPTACHARCLRSP